jgi:hypothetical protein
MYMQQKPMAKTQQTKWYYLCPKKNTILDALSVKVNEV